jgi:hypothetical protein
MTIDDENIFPDDLDSIIGVSRDTPHQPELVWLNFYAANNKDQFIGGAAIRTRSFSQAIEHAKRLGIVSPRAWVVPQGMRYSERFPPELEGKLIKPNKFRELDELVWIGCFGGYEP